VGDTLARLGITTPPPGAFTALGLGFPAFRQVSFSVPTDFGAGPPQNTALAVARMDYALSDRSLIYGRDAYTNRDIFRGALSFSPFAGFNTGVSEVDHNAAFNWLFPISSVGCCASPGATPWTGNFKINYNRINISRQIDTNTLGPRLFLTGHPASNLGGVLTLFPGDVPFDPTLNS